MVAISVNIVRGGDRQPVNALLVGLSPKHIADFEALWKAQLRQFSQDDKYWDWAFKQRLADTRDNYEAYAVECEGQAQGLMMLETQRYRAKFFSGQRIVYVASLAVAPWNRKRVQRPPRFRTVGSVLLEFSRLRSVQLGYDGCVGLHSSPDAEGFYERCNMMRLDPDPDDFIDPDEKQLTYFEYSPLES
ncbi:MAG: GNAT family N-acetyltransferase [Cyanobacteria bacterium J06650_10]